MKKFISRRAIELCVLFGLICSIFLSMAHFDAACDDLRTNVLRLHIIANSDSEIDQNLKLAIRDRILQETTFIFDGKKNIKEAEKAVTENMSCFKKITNDVIKQYCMNYSSSVSLGNSYFETREYDDFTLPAGTYRSLIIKLGKAKGHNWWCVVFPSICISAASDGDLSDSTSNETAYIAEHPNKYIIKFKIVEIYEDIKNFIVEKLDQAK